MTDCAPCSLTPFLSPPWPVALFVLLVMVVLVGFIVWQVLDNRRYWRAMAMREQIRTERWAARDPEGYAAVMQRRAEEEALVTARLAERQPWWRRIHRRSQA